MREFFRGWRRKVGCVALVMALALSVVWMRSQLVTDTRRFFTDTGVLILRSEAGGFSIMILQVNEIRPLTAMVGYDIVADWDLNYLVVALPVSLLSAYLILWMPRKATMTEPTTRPIPGIETERPRR